MYKEVEVDHEEIEEVVVEEEVGKVRTERTQTQLMIQERLLDVLFVNLHIIGPETVLIRMSKGRTMTAIMKRKCT